MTEYLELAIMAAHKAGKSIMLVYGTDFTHAEKADLSPLTKADLDAHLYISEHLKPSGLPLLSEEGRHIPFSERSSWNEFWLVDPLDGTREFIKRNHEFTVNIALIHQHYPVLGVIYVPVSGQLYFADHDGAFISQMQVEGNPDTGDILRHARKLPLSGATESYTVICSRSHLTPATEAFLRQLEEKRGNIRITNIGSSLKLCLVAEGSADCYPRLGPTMEWDTAAGQAIVEAAGGVVEEFESGSRLRYNKPDLLNPWFIARWPSDEI